MKPTTRHRAALLLSTLLIAACADDASKKGPPTGTVDAATDGGGNSGGSDAELEDASNPIDAADLGRDMEGSGDAGPDDACDDQASAGWVDLGGPLNALSGSASATDPHLIVDDECRPVVAWAEESSTVEGQVVVQRWDGSRWEPLGTPFDSDGDPSNLVASPILASNGDRLFVVWVENVGGFRFFAAEYQAGAWAPLVGLPEVVTFVPRVDATIDPAGRIVISLTSDGIGDAATDVGVFRLEGNTWRQLGPWLDEVAGQQSALAPSIAIGPQGEPVVGWQEGNSVFVRRWDGTGWLEFGPGTLSQDGNTERPFDVKLERGTNGELFAGWRQPTNESTDVFVRRWSGQAWEVVADELDAYPNDANEDSTNTFDVEVNADSAGRALIAWTESKMALGNGTDDVHVRRAERGTIVPLGSGVFDANGSDLNVNLPSLAVDLRDRVVLAFTEETSGGGRAIYVKRYRNATSP